MASWQQALPTAFQIPKGPIPDPDQQQPKGPKGQDATPYDPNNRTPQASAQAVQLTDRQQNLLIDIKKRYKTIWTPIRRLNCRRTLKAFEYLKGNCYLAFDYDNFEFVDAFSGTDAVAGDQKGDDTELYRFTDNIYQMLCLSFIAALSPRAPATRYQPVDAQNELDLKTAERASTMMQLIEEQNEIKSLQKLELLHLWTGGVYFSYTRYLVDEDQAGVTKQPITAMVPTQVAPARMECPQCGTATPDDQISPMGVPRCPKCGSELNENEDWHPPQTMPMPQKVGTEEIPNGMTKIDAIGLLNVDAAPYAQKLYQTPILDFEIESDVADVRSRYPGAWDKIQSSAGSAGVPEAEADRIARLRLFGGTSSRSGYLSDSLPTFSRCWIQPWAFNILDNKADADGLRELFPKGVKLVSLGDTFLEAVGEKLTTCWSWCPTIEGMGLYPFAVGDAALDIQERINDVANLTHEHMDRNASPPILVDGDALDTAAMSQKANLPGGMVELIRRNTLIGKPLSDLVFQPSYHIDNNIYTYGESLIMRAQLVCGVQPQIFGGSDPNVKTAHGQAQMLNTALGRLKLFWDQIGIEHARRSYLAVKCMTEHMDDELRVVVDGDTESGFENEFVLLTEMQGEFHAFPETDEEFPSTYGEIRDRIMQFISDPNAGKNPYLAAFLADPDNQKLIDRYVAPPGSTLPGDAERSKVKQIIAVLAKSAPQTVPGPQGQAIEMPSVTPDPDMDDMNIWVVECKKWGQRNWEARYSNPNGYDNVKAALKLASQYQAMAMLAQSAQVQAAAAGGPGGTSGAPPAGGGAPPNSPAPPSPGAPGKLAPMH